MVDDYRLAELLTLQPPLIAGAGYYDPEVRGDRVAEQRDTDAIEQAWRELEDQLLALWIAGWQPELKFTGPVQRGGPGTRPPGWWRFCATEPRRPGEVQAAYLERHHLWLPGERDSTHKK